MCRGWIAVFLGAVSCGSTSASDAAAPTAASAPSTSEVGPRAVGSAGRVILRSQDAPLPLRADVEKAIAQVKPGMDAADVEKLLGPPDDIRGPEDGITATRTTQVWRYGTDGHLSFATLGTVHLETTGAVQYVFGDRGEPPKLSIAEVELRRLLRLIDAVPSYDAPADPLRIIQAVNALVPLGKDGAASVLGEYLRVSSHFEDPGREGVFHVLRTLFDPPPSTGVFPHMRVGSPSPGFPPNDKDAPRFPIVIVDDIPFVGVRGYALAGLAESPEMHLAWMKDHAELRKAKLSPTSTPIATLEKMVGAPKTPFVTALGLHDTDRSLFMEQGARLLAHVVPTGFNAALPPDDAWKVFESARAVSFTWSTADDDYLLVRP